MKIPVCIVLCLCSLLVACTKENPEPAPKRRVQARLTGAQWSQYQPATALRDSCPGEGTTHDDALTLLAEAGGDCLDHAVHAVSLHAKEDLAAAYLTRFERKHDPMDLLHASETAQGFNRALTLEQLFLTREAISAWNAVAAEHSDWSGEARQHQARLIALRDPAERWPLEEVRNAVAHRDTAALNRMVRTFPTDAAHAFERLDFRDRDGARLLAKELAQTGEPYPQAVVHAMESTHDRAALDQGLAAFQIGAFPEAAPLLERAGNPLSLAARYYANTRNPSLPALNATISHLGPDDHELTARMRMWRAALLEFDDRYLDAHADYKLALAAAHGDPTLTADALSRRSVNSTTIGAAEAAFADAYKALTLLDRVADIDTRHKAFAATAIATRALGYPALALRYQDAAVETVQRAAAHASGNALKSAKHELAVALRVRAEIQVVLGRFAEAEADLVQGTELAESIDRADVRDPLRMRLRDVRGQLALGNNDPNAVALFSEAIDLASQEDSTYRAVLHFERAAARHSAGDARADDDTTAALTILRDEVRGALERNPQTESVPLWEPYFKRFRARHDELIEHRLAAGDIENAFLQSEFARAFEPMQILLQSRSMPPGFRPLETAADLRQARAALPADTVILQFLVLPGKTYTWVLTRERMTVVRQRATRRDIERWTHDVLESAGAKQRDPVTRNMRAVYGELFREPLAQAPGKTRIVIVPDTPMQGLPFNALVGTKDEGHLIERASITVAGSTSLYLHALARDRQLSARGPSPVLLVGDPAFDSVLFPFPSLPYARKEVEQLERDDYNGAEVLIGQDATIERFLAAARNAMIIHFAGHALASEDDPWQSRLLLAPRGQESGELSSQKLMQELPRLEHTRLVVLGACSTASGGALGPQGLAPLIRPLIGADVPSVVGSLWDVQDASTKPLLVSFHCHYRHGDDVATALRNAQLEQLRNNEPAMTWAAFQVAGYAASPYPRSIALEDPSSELCSANSLHRPDGLHSQ